MAEPLRVIVRPSDAWKVVKEAPDPGVGAIDVANQPGSPWTVQKEAPAPAPVQATPPTPGPWTVQKEEPAPEARGIVERTLGGIKHGFGERPLGVSPEVRAENPGWQAVQPLVAPIDAAMRTIPAAVGGLAGLGAGAFEALGGSQASADRLQRDLGQGGEMAMVAGGLRYGKAPRVAKEILAPEIVSPVAEDAAALIRQETGKAARATETTTAQVEAWQKPVNQLAPADQLGIMHHIEGTGPPPATPQMQALADTLKNAFEERKVKLQALPQHAQRAFIEDYFPHFWTDPAAAANAVRSGGVYKQGSGASLKTRTIPTIMEGINAGLTPLTTNPIEATLRYITSMDKYIAATEILNQAKAAGTVQYVKPKIVGASGHPESFQVPPGMAPLKGRGADTPAGKAYAPEDWARVYNNFISRGFEDIGGGEFGNIYQAARRSANFVTQLKLSLSGYHAFTMAEAAMSNQMAKAVSETRHGAPFSAAKEFGRAFIAPVEYAPKGLHLKDIYLGKVRGTPEEQGLVDLITKAGGRMGSSKHAIDYDTSALGSYVKAFRRGRLRMEMLAAGQDIKAHPVLGTVRQVATGLGRAMDTFNEPLFQHYIPAIKNAAAAENVAQWLKQNPAATQAEKLAATRKIVDSVDNRFGEMIQDNIFWHKMAKQSAMLAMLSYSWNMGGIREVGGGLRDIAQVGKKPWTAKADYVVGMTLNWAIMSAIYQTLKTGTPPENLQDLMAPRTGGTDFRSGEPERIIPPGIMKDVFAYREHGLGEIGNKLTPLFKTSKSLLTNRDYRDLPIVSPREEDESALQAAPRWLAEYFNFILKDLAPIGVTNVSKGAEVGSALNPLELALGIRTAPRQLIDPEGHEAMLRRLEYQKWFGKRGRGGKLQADERERQRYQGPE